jgi:transcriptional regulator with XRE-family HTH domain
MKKTISTLRKERGWSQEDLGVRSHLSLKSISRLETGKPINKSTFALVCAALEISPDQVDLTGVKLSSRVGMPGA